MGKRLFTKKEKRIMGNDGTAAYFHYGGGCMIVCLSKLLKLYTKIMEFIQL